MNSKEASIMDYSKTALVLIDLQKGIAAMETAPHSAETVISNAVKMAEAFKENGGFVAYVRVNFHDGKDKLAPNAMRELPGKPQPDFADFVDELAVSDTDYIINKDAYQYNYNQYFVSDMSRDCLVTHNCR